MTPEEQKCPVCELSVVPEEIRSKHDDGFHSFVVPRGFEDHCWGGVGHWKRGYERLAERVRALEGERDAARREGWLAGRKAASHAVESFTHGSFVQRSRGLLLVAIADLVPPDAPALHGAQERLIAWVKTARAYMEKLGTAGCEGHNTYGPGERGGNRMTWHHAPDCRRCALLAAPALPEKPPQEAQAAEQKGSK